MGKKRGKEGPQAQNAGTHQTTTLREENTGTQHISVSSILQMQHLQKLALWSGREGGIPPLSALFGHRLAASSEAVGKPLDPALVLCERCETILQPGFNCTVRIEKNVKKTRWRKKSRNPFQNNVVYMCHFCSHHNLKAGTQKGCMKDLLVSRQKTEPEVELNYQGVKGLGVSDKGVAEEERFDQNKQDKVSLKPAELKSVSSPHKDAMVKEFIIKRCPGTPLVKLSGVPEKKGKGSGSAPNKLATSGNMSTATDSANGTGGSSKRRRKQWSSLKEITESNELVKSRCISNFAIPFLI